MSGEKKCMSCDKEMRNGSIFFFHSKCCRSHFEGVIYTGIDGKQAFLLVCEKCGKFVGVIDKEPYCITEFLQKKILKELGKGRKKK